jgi:hypothetical protein
MTPGPEKNSIILKVADFSAKFHSKNFYLKLGIISAKGSIDASLSKVSASVKLQVLTQTLETGRVVPAFKVLHTSVNIPKHHIKIKIHGNIIAKIANFLKSIFMGIVRKEIEKSVHTALMTKMAPQINKLMKQT